MSDSSTKQCPYQVMGCILLVMCGGWPSDVEVVLQFRLEGTLGDLLDCMMERMCMYSTAPKENPL